MKLLKAIKSSWQGLMATAENPEYCSDYTDKLQKAVRAIKFSEVLAKKLALLQEATDFIIKRENETDAELVAAAEALRMIDCLINDKEYLLPVEIKRIREIAVDARRATADDSGVVAELCTDDCPFKGFKNE